MKPREALNQFYKMNAKMGMFLPDTFTFSDEDLKVVDVFKTLVAKATPMKPITNKLTGWTTCPDCETFLSTEYPSNFCGYCGQSINETKRNVDILKQP